MATNVTFTNDVLLSTKAMAIAPDMSNALGHGLKAPQTVNQDCWFFCDMITANNSVALTIDGQVCGYNSTWNGGSGASVMSFFVKKGQTIDGFRDAYIYGLK